MHDYNKIYGGKISPQGADDPSLLVSGKGGGHFVWRGWQLADITGVALSGHPLIGRNHNYETPSERGVMNSLDFAPNAILLPTFLFFKENPHTPLLNTTNPV